MSSSSRRAQKAAARAKLKQRRQGIISSTDLDDTLEIHDEEDIYEIVDENEYQNLVESRRQREDFVVDDDGLGYYDDGEERLGDEDHDNARSRSDKNKKRTSGAALTNKVLKKARKTKALSGSSTAATTGGGDLDDHDDDDEDGGVSKNRSMWDFVQRGVGVSNNRGSSFQSKQQKQQNLLSASHNVDALLEQLDEAAPSTAGGGPRRVSTGGAGHRRRGGVYGSSSNSRRVSTGRRPRSMEPSIRRGRPNVSSRSSSLSRRPPPRQEDDFPYNNDDDDDDNHLGGWDDGNDDDNNDHMEVDKKDDNDNDESPQTKKKSSPNSKKTDDDDEETSPSSSTSTPGRVRFAEELESTTNIPSRHDDNEDGGKDNDDDDGVVRPRRRLSRPKLGQKLSAPARKAKEEEEKKKQQQQQEANTTKSASPTPTMSAAQQEAMKNASFKPEEMATEMPMSVLPSAANLENFVQIQKIKIDDENNDEEERNYLDMFWIDVAEKGTGEILLFGKVAVPQDDKGSTKSKSIKYISCCAVVQNNVRNLFVLPRKNSDGEYASMADVHQEMNTILRGPVIPKVDGASWAGKVVQRKYAFDDPTIPREETDYLKIVYHAKYPNPPEDVCLNGGQHFARILGAGASQLETFIIKRKLMGPCWIRIYNPQPSSAPVSWCKLELKVPEPKDIKRLDLVEDCGTVPPAPPMVTVAIKLKTVVNPKSQKSEVVSVSAICHQQVQLDTSSDESGRHMTQISIIRPLPGMGGVHEGGLPKFPRDLEQEVARTMPQLRREVNERALLSRLLTQIGLWDPDVIVGHNAWGFDADVLLNRSKELKVQGWSKLGRRRRTKMPSKSSFSARKDYAIQDAMSGRLLCDTYLTAKELLRETTYSLTNLSATLLKTPRQEIEPVDIPQWFQSSKTIVQLARHTLLDTQLVMRLMFKLQILPLTKQLTCIAGNFWSHTMKSNRSERTEYLLLHEFHRLKHLVPEKQRFGKKKDANANGKPKYSGGMVLEPKKGLYHSFILLLDFNSLYPSLIQEYNLCFTTIDWASFTGTEALDNPEGEGVEDSPANLPPLPDESMDQGVLPRVIKSLVERRRKVKKLLKSEKDIEKAKEVNFKCVSLCQ